MKLTITKKLIAGFIILFIVISIFGFYMLSVNRSSLEKAIGDNSVILAEDMINHIDNEVFIRLEQISRFIKIPLIQSELVSSNESFDNIKNVESYIMDIDEMWISTPTNETSSFMDDLINNSLSDLLRDVFIYSTKGLFEHEDYSEVFVTNKYGANVAQTGRTSDYYQADERWWKDAYENKFSIGEFEYDESAERWSVPIGVFISDSTGSFIGVIKAIIPVSMVLEEADSFTKKYGTADIIIINNDGDIIYKDGKFGFLGSVTEQNFYQEMVGDSGFFVSKDNLDNKLFSFARSKGSNNFYGLGWTLIISYDTEDIFLSVNNLQNILLTAIIILLLVIIIFSIIFSKSISRPIKKLTKVSQLIAGGNLSARAGRSSIYEVDQLGEAFNKMASNVSESILNLKQINAMNKAILSSLGEGLVVVDKDRHITIINNSAVNMFGLTDKKLEGKLWPDILREGAITDEEDNLIKEKDLPVYKILKNGGKMIKGTYKYRRLDKAKFSVSVTSTPVILANKEVSGVVEIFRDVTKERRIDRAKSEFISLASHQLRTPLTAIKLFTDMLSKDKVGKLSESQIRYLDSIKDSNERMIVLVNDLLNISRIESDKLKIELKSTNLISEIQDIIAKIVPIAERRKCNIVFENPSNLSPEIPIDPILLRQVLSNLINNSIQYSVGGCIINVLVNESNSEYIISVKDNGIGIPEGSKGRIFEKFFRAENAIKADTGLSGLGLYLVKVIIEATGGKVWFESTEGVGSTFYVSIPKSGMKKVVNINSKE